MFIIVFTKTHHFSLSWVTSFESTLSHHISLRSDLIFSSRLCRVLPSGLYFSGIPTFYSFLFHYKSLAISVPFLSSYDVCWFCIMYHHIGTTAWFQPWLPQWCFSVCCFGFPVVRSRHRFLLREQFSFHPACISWGFVTEVVLQGEGISFISNHRLVDEASIFMSPQRQGGPAVLLDTEYPF